MLSAAPSSADDLIEVANPAMLVAPPVSANEWVAGTIRVFHGGAEVATFVPADDTDVERGLALRAALAAAQPFDELVLDAATYDMGGFEHVEFRDRLTVIGAGKELTKITSSCPQDHDGAATFTLNHLSILEDLWLEGSLHNGQYQPLVGMQGGPVENVEAYLRRLKITGDSDGIFIWTGSQYTYTIYATDCDISTRYDAVAVLGSGYYPQTVMLYNCNITVQQPSAIPDHSSNAVNVRAGFVGLYNCTVTVTGDPNSLQSAGVWCYGAGSAAVVNSTFNVTAPAGFANDLLLANGAPCNVIGGTGSGPGGSFTSSDGTETYGTPSYSTVINRGLFYNDSAYDDSNPRADVLDFTAQALDKTPLLPGGGVASFANVSNYSRGINGISFDLIGYHGSLTADDFLFTMGNDNDPESWLPAPTPLAVTMFDVDGTPGLERVEIVWANGEIRNTWLRVEVLPTARTDLIASDVFYWGNKTGDVGTNSPPNFFVTSGADLTATRNSLGIADLESAYDFNRDGLVTAADVTIVSGSLGSLIRLDVGGAPSALPEEPPAVVEDEPEVQAFALPSATTAAENASPPGNNSASLAATPQAPLGPPHFTRFHAPDKATGRADATVANFGSDAFEFDPIDLDSIDPATLALLAAPRRGR